VSVVINNGKALILIVSKVDHKISASTPDKRTGFDDIAAMGTIDVVDIQSVSDVQHRKVAAFV